MVLFASEMYGRRMSNNIENSKEQPLSERGSNRSQRPRSENFKSLSVLIKFRPDGLPHVLKALILLLCVVINSVNISAAIV